MKVLLYLAFTFFICSSAHADTNIVYYKKESDPIGVIETLRKIDGANVVPIDGPSKYYNDRGLGSNSLMCGEGTDENLVRKVFVALASLGIEIQYFGKFYRPEKNSRVPSIDIRSVNDPSYYANYKALTVGDIDEIAGDFCGQGAGLQKKLHPNKDDKVVQIISGIPVGFVEDFVKIIEAQGGAVSQEEVSDEKVNLKVTYE